MLVEFDDGTTFAKGGAGYNVSKDYWLSDHVILVVEIGEQTRTVMWEAVVNTDVPYLVCSPQIARAVGIDQTRPEADARVRIQGELIDGRLYSGINLILLADEDKGESVPHPVWAFVPDREEDFKPNNLPEMFLGFKRCLDTFLFAVDPLRETFYFG